MIPRPTEDSARTILSTPLSIIGMVIEVIRLRFKKGVFSNPALEWEWEPLEEAVASNPNNIFIESGFNTNIDAYTVRPGIWIDRDQNVYQKKSIGHQDQMPVNISSRLERFYAGGECDVVVDCTSPNRGESMVIGSVVQDHLQMSSNIIQACFGLRDISDVVLNRTVPFDKDDKLWNSPIQFRIYYEIRWASFPVASLMKNAYLGIAGDTDPEQHFRNIAINGTRVPEE